MPWVEKKHRNARTESVSVWGTHHRPTPLETLLFLRGFLPPSKKVIRSIFLHSCRARRALITRHRTRVAFGCGVRRALARQLFKSSAAPASAVRSDGGGGGGPTLPRAALSDRPMQSTNPQSDDWGLGLQVGPVPVLSVHPPWLAARTSSPLSPATRTHQQSWPWARSQAQPSDSTSSTTSTSTTKRTD